MQKLKNRYKKLVVCAGCERKFPEDKQYAYLGGDYYCSCQCYDKLFVECLECHELSMDAKTDPEQLCSRCHDKKYKLESVTLRFDQWRRTR